MQFMLMLYILKFVMYLNFLSSLHLICFFNFLQYGHFFPDPQYENVQHIICCNSFATYTYDFEFANNDVFSR